MRSLMIMHICAIVGVLMQITECYSTVMEYAGNVFSYFKRKPVLSSY